MSILIDGNSSINTDGIRLLMDNEGIDEDEQSFVTEQIMTYLSTAITTFNKK